MYIYILIYTHIYSIYIITINAYFRQYLYIDEYIDVMYLITHF